MIPVHTARNDVSILKQL